MKLRTTLPVVPSVWSSSAVNVFCSVSIAAASGSWNSINVMYCSAMFIFWVSWAGLSSKRCQLITPGREASFGASAVS